MNVPPAVIEQLDGEKAQSAASMLKAHLLAALRSASAQAVNSDMTLVARCIGGDPIGGLSGGTSYGWLHVDVLWVAGTHRRQGIGRQLLAAAATIAKERGCHMLWLDTSNPQARDFYCHLGYEIFGELANSPEDGLPSHRRWFFRSPLDRAGG